MTNITKDVLLTYKERTDIKDATVTFMSTLLNESEGNRLTKIMISGTLSLLNDHINHWFVNLNGMEELKQSQMESEPDDIDEDDAQQEGDSNENDK